MNIRKNLFFRSILTTLLVLFSMGNAYAVRYQPVFENRFNSTSDNWYYMHFVNGNSGYMYSLAENQHFKRGSNQAQNPNFFWQLVGDNQSGFALVSMSGMYGYWNNGFLTGTTNANQADKFRLIAGTDADSWSVQKISSSGTADCLNPQGNSEVKTWNSDNGCRLQFKIASATDLSAAKDIAFPDLGTLGSNVRLKFVDDKGKTLSSQIVVYSPQGGVAVNLSPTMETYDFANVPYSRNLFSITENYNSLSVSFDNDRQILTFTITTDPNVLRFSSQPTSAGWATDTHWFTLRNNRNNQNTHNRKFVTTSATGVNTDFNILPILASLPDDRGGYWCFVGDNTKGFVIQNAAYGPDFVLGIYGNDGQNNIVRMVLKDDIPSGYNTVFTAVDNAVIDDATHAYAFRIGLTGNSHVHVTNGNFYRYNNQSAMSSGDTGSAFKLTAADADDFNNLTEFDVYKTIWSDTNIANLSISYPQSANVFGRRGSVNDGNFFIVKRGVSLSASDFTVTSSDGYALDEVLIEKDKVHYYRTLTLNIIDALATELWTVHVDNAYTVSYRDKEFQDGQTFKMRPGVIPSYRDLKIHGAEHKFAWGPILDRKERTVTYEVRDLATDIVSGWYQLQLIGNNTQIEARRDQIVPENGNINTSANTLYLSPAIYEPGNNRNFKLTGIPTYADASATFVYISDEGNGNLILQNSATGVSLTGTQFTFNNGRLTKSANWSFENQAHPLEGPYLLAQGNQVMEFNVSPANLSEYNIFRVNIIGNNIPSGVRLSIHNSNILGNNVVGNGGYIFMKKDVPVLSRADFVVKNGNVHIEKVEVGDKENDITPITISVSTLETVWHVYLTGEAVSSQDRIIYNGINYVNGAAIGVSVGTVPTALDFNTTVTDRFVWGPIIDADHQTVTFDIRPRPQTLESGWYQIQLLDNTKIQSVNNRIANNSGNINTRSNYIYVLPMYNNSTTTLAKFGGIPTYADEPSSYVYINKINASTITVQTPEGRYIRNGSAEGGQTTPQNITRWRYNSRLLEMAGWTAPGYWNGNTSVGNNAGNQGPIVATGDQNTYYQQHYITRVNVEDKYDVYKIDLTSTGQNKVRYVGNDNHGNTEVYNNGYLFLTKGSAAPSKDKFRLEGNIIINSITIGAGNVISFNVSTPSYSKEIVHRQAYYFDDLDTEKNPPSDGFIEKGEGMSTREGTTGIITEQNTAVFPIPVYLKQGTSMTSYMPTDQVKRYQRWYNWDTDGRVDETVLTSLTSWNVSEANTYDNGHLTGDGYGGYRNNPTLTLPVGKTSYNVGLDLAHYPTRGNIGNALVEPTLAMRIVYQLRDAKIIAREIKAKTKSNDFYEVHNISFPNIKRGNTEDKTSSNLLPLNMDLNNYWIFNGDGESDAELQQLLQSGGAQIQVELGEHSEGAELQNLMLIPSSASEASGNISRTSFNTGHFILFKYPEGGVIPANATATVNVYITNNNGSRRYNLAKFNLTFIGNAEPIAVTELEGSHRHPNALIDAFGAPVAELTFDNKTNNKYGSWYKYPLKYEGVSYAFGTMVSGGGHTGWFASRGEYGLCQDRNSSKALGGGTYYYYPVNNYLRNMGNADASLGTKENDSYFLYIDAADQPGKVASIALEDALCAGSRLYCYGYIGCTSGGTDQNPTSVLINVMGIDKNTGEEVLIYSYCPGIISLRAYDSNNRRIYASALGRSTVYEAHGDDNNYWAPWQQIGFSFAISADIASQMKGYSIQIVNNAYNSNGADTVLDDFEIFVKKPGAEVQNTTPLCSDQIRHIKVITEYQTLIESTGDDSNHDGMMNIGFCFLDKAIYDQVLQENADKDIEHGYARNNPENKYNKAFGAALMGSRTLNKENKDHAFHNFDIIRDGEVSTIDGISKKRFYTDIPQYSFKESKDDAVYRDSIRGERYVVFKESVVYDSSNKDTHKWMSGKSYYLLFSSASISEEHVNNHDLGCTVFNLDDNRCAVLYEFTVAPPVSVKGDVERITSGDEVQACAGQTATLVVNLNGRTDTKDVIIKNLNYDWWMSAPTHEVFQMEYGVPVRDAEGNRIPVLDGEGNLQIKEYNTVPATLQNYMNVWYGFYQQDNRHLDKKKGDKIYLSDALLELRRAYPTVTNLVGVVPVHKSGDTVEYELTQDMIDCVAHFLEPDENGYPPLLLMKKEMNLTLGIDYADKDKVVHFVVIPIAPSIYSVDEDAIYCPDPQELKVKLLNEAPSLMNGFNNMNYPDVLTNIPMRVGLQQINAVRHRSNEPQRTLTIPLRKAVFAYPEVGVRLIKTFEPDLYMVGSDDPEYKKTESTSKYIDQSVDGDDIEDLFINVGRIEVLSVEKNEANPTMQITFNNNVIFREGYTYTLKVKYHEVMGDNQRDNACEGSFVFDMKVVPEYQVWTGAAGNTDWTNDRNWARADRTDLNAGNQSTGDKMPGATALDDATSYVSNAVNTTSSSFVPMYFTNVLFNNADQVPAVQLYKGNDFLSPVMGTNFLEGLSETSTRLISYDLSVTPVKRDDRETMNYDCDFECEMFDTYIANGVTFTPGAQMGNAHYLKYRKAWVEYMLDANRWYTLASPLKNSFAGDWYSPTDGGKQNTPHFYEINYSPQLNDRFRPAYFQRSWDREGNNKVYLKTGGNYDSYIRADWSYVYNDALVNYSTGGFSVKPELDYMDSDSRPADNKVLVRLPKSDESYTYYDVNGQTGQAADAQMGDRTNSYRLLSDDLHQDGSGVINMTVANATPDNNFLLLSNPFMASMDMDEFFARNTDLEEKYWILDANSQVVSVKAANQWLTTGNNGKYIAPLQGFFVKKKADAIIQNSAQVVYTADMQKVNVKNEEAPVVLRSRSNAPEPASDVVRITAERNGAHSTAIIAISDQATDDYKYGEDCEAFVDANLYDVPTVYTSANAMAQTVNVRKTMNMVPMGIISSDDSDVTLCLDLSQSSYNTLYLYDIKTDTYTDINDGTQVMMSGNNSGRYFLTTSIEDSVDNSEEVRQGVWNMNGIYCGKSIHGLTPGLYIVDGVKMMIPSK